MQKKKESKTQHIQSFITAPVPKALQNNFNMHLCDAFIGANIPLEKLRNPILKGFLEKYTSNEVPDPSTQSKNYVPKSYNKVHKVNIPSSDHYWINFL